MSQTKKMNQYELDEAICQLIDPKPAKPGNPKTCTASPGGHWHWCRVLGVDMWKCFFAPTSDIAHAWPLFVEMAEQCDSLAAADALRQIINMRDCDWRTTLAIQCTMAHLTPINICRAYYLWQTGIRVGVTES